MGKRVAGLIIVILGVSLASLFATRNGERISAALSRAGAAQLAQGKVKATHEAYCAARAENELPKSPECPSDEEKQAAKEKEAAEPAQPAVTSPPSAAAIEAAERERIADLKASAGQLPPEVAEKRTAWLAALEAAASPTAIAKAAETNIPAGDRLGQWFSLAGLPFLGGVALIIFGALVARRGAREEAMGTTPAAGARTTKPLDFGEALAAVHQAVVRLAEQAAEEPAPQATRYEAIQQEIETLQFERIEPIVDARDRMQALYGMAGYAAVFSAFSGGERNLNRAWSALVDRHWPEATASLETAAAHFREAHGELTKLAS